MANAIATLTRHLTEMIDSVFVAESKTEILENGSKFIDLNFKEAGYVKVYEMEVDRLGNYWRANSLATGDGSLAAGTADPAGSRDGHGYSQYEGTYEAGYASGAEQRDGFSRGAVSGHWELLQLRYYRSKQFLVDQMDDEETAGMIIGNLLTEFMRRAVVPEVDVVRFATIVDAARLGGKVVTADYTDAGAGTTSIIAEFNKAFVELMDKEVPEEDQVIFVSPTVWGLLLADPSLTRFITQENYKSDSGVTFNLKAYMGRPILPVPSNRFFTDVALTDNGYKATSTSKKINFIICSKRAIVPVVKLDYNKIWEPSQIQDFIGYKVNFALYHDCFVMKNKRPAIFASLAATEGVSVNKIIPVKEGGKVVSYTTNPQGLRGELYMQATAGTIGEAPTSATKVVLGVTSISTNKLVLVAGGKIVAVE